MPEWLKSASCCPWNSKEEFYADFHGEKMISLRKFLCDTKDLQSIFIAKRLELTLPQILNSCCESEKCIVEQNFYRLFHSPKGLYALIDYLNFKGSGISSKETYRGKGWGLLQVLQSLPINSLDPLSEFVLGAKSILKERVENAPEGRNEKKWLEGWFNRLNTYL